jgi:acetylornithine deacetylase/succinyl-diaminopimelate desuccinylase family protein
MEKSFKSLDDMVLATLSDLVGIESINPQFGGSGEAKVADYIVDFFKDCQPVIERQDVFPGRQNIICKFTGTNLNKTLLLEAHMDTVSIADGARSTLVPQIENGKLYARGACDTKGSLAAMICAIKSIINANGCLPISVYFVGAVDEEYRAKGIYEFIKKDIKVDGAVVGEPTSLKIVVAHKGVFRFHLNTEGKSVQSSKPWFGVNAIYKMMDAVRAILEELQPNYIGKGPELTGDPTVSVGVIHGGKEVNTVPDSCRVEIDRRVVPGEQHADVEAEFESLLTSLRSRDETFKATITNTFYDPPLDTDSNAKIVQSMAKACRDIVGDANIIGVPYGSDASKLASIGIPSIVFGPGDIVNAHTSHEFVNIQELVDAAKIYRKLILDFASDV